MKKLVISTTLMLVSASSFAQLNSKEFVNCFVKAANEIIADYHANGSKSEKKRLCKQISQNTIDNILKDYTIIEEGQLRYFAASVIGSENMKLQYDYIKNKMDCYGNAVKGQGGSLFGAVANSFAYNKNLGLTRDALDKMAGQDLEEGFFADAFYGEINDLDLSYCK